MSKLIPLASAMLVALSALPASALPYTSASRGSYYSNPAESIYQQNPFYRAYANTMRVRSIQSPRVWTVSFSTNLASLDGFDPALDRDRSYYGVDSVDVFLVEGQGYWTSSGPALAPELGWYPTSLVADWEFGNNGGKTSVFAAYADELMNRNHPNWLNPWRYPLSGGLPIALGIEYTNWSWSSGQGGYYYATYLTHSWPVKKAWLDGLKKGSTYIDSPVAVGSGINSTDCRNRLAKKTVSPYINNDVRWPWPRLTGTDNIMCAAWVRGR